MKKFIRKHKKLSVGLMIFLMLFMFISVAYGKYIYNTIYNYILETKEFYFTSSILTDTQKNYSINNWDGANSIDLTVDVSNRKNSMKKTNNDITYDITISCSTNVTCSKSKNDGIIYKENEEDSFTVTVTPVTSISEDEEAVITIKATSTSPFIKEISAVYHLGVEKSKFTYRIIDNPNDVYFTLELTNSLTYYRTREAFGSYAANAIISLDNYKNLSDSDKEKCYSATITLSFNPSIVYLDQTGNAYYNKTANSETTSVYSGNSYISGFTFEMAATSAEKVVFFKRDRTQNYTYPNLAGTNPIVTVNVVSAE